MMQITTHSADETQALGQKLASRLAPGDVIAYFGDLGAGKTAFTRGLAQGLGITDPVTSPTYTIVNEYLSGRIPPSKISSGLAYLWASTQLGSFLMS